MSTRLLLAGFVMVLIGISLLFVGSMESGNVSTGGFVLIGPFPIVFGSGTNGIQLAFLAVVTGIAMLVLVYILAMRMRRREADQREEIHK